ncbi:hypothetical protein HanOQP8_Chr06g0212691 [Helianthus annuus]|nr:hypothetical protein HanOQP8_Chr06g0212691 [Helianthus annuus]
MKFTAPPPSVFFRYAVGQWRWSLFSEDDGMPINTYPPHAATFVCSGRRLVMKVSGSDDDGWWRWWPICVSLSRFRITRYNCSPGDGHSRIQ